MTKTASDFLPQIGYWNENTGITSSGALFAMMHVTGFASDLASASSLINMRNSINMAIMSASAPNVEIWHHFVRAENQKPTVLNPCNSWFGKRLDAAYRKCLSDDLFRNDLFFTILIKPDFSPLKIVKKWLLWEKEAPGNLPAAGSNFEQDFEETVERFMGQLAMFGVRRLGVRKDDNGIEFQEIAEAYHYILHGFSRNIALTAGASRMGRQIITSQPEFGHKAYALHNDVRNVYGSMLSFFDYPKTVNPILFDGLIRAPFGFTMTNSFCCVQRTQAIEKLDLLRKKRQSGQDKATGATEDLNREMNELADREFVRGSHHFSLSIRGMDVGELDRNVGRASTLLSNRGITVARENEAQKAAFFSQIPGNAHLRPRPAGINSRNFSSFASLHNVPYGRSRSRWGGPVIMLRSSADTEYALHLQAQGPQARPGEDVANILSLGGVGSGKTTLKSLILTALDRLGVQRVVIDKDKGLAPCVEANGGEYFVLPSGHETGIAPLMAAQNTPEWCSHLNSLLVDLITSGGNYELTPDEDQRLQRAIELQVQLPPSERCLGGIRAMLGQRDISGAAARLRRWCRGERLGWVFDGHNDRIVTSNLLTGFDTTELLKEPEVSSPLLRHIFFRMNQRVDGTPMMFLIDEFWRAGSVDVFQEFTQDASKTGRKRELALMLSTQSARDAIATPIGYTLKEQYPTKIFFGDQDATLMDLCGDDENNPHLPHLGLSLAEFRAVTGALPNMRHAFLMKRPGASVILRNDMRSALAQVSVLSGRDATYLLMRELQKKYGSAPEEWVPHFEKMAPELASEPKAKSRIAA